MNRFLTLIRRDLADHRGTVFWTPMIVAAVLAIFVMFAVIAGRISLGEFTGDFQFDGTTTISVFGVDNLRPVQGEGGKLLFDDGTGAKPFHAFLDATERAQVESQYAVLTGLLTLPLVLLAMITLPFALSSTLYEERKDRSILFWKSMPVSDLEAVGSRMLSLPLGTMVGALVAGFALHLIVFLLGLFVVIGNGFLPGLSFGMIGAVLQAWAILTLMAVLFVLWAAPVHAWFLAVSAAAPKAPFIIAVAPFLLIPLFGSVIRVNPDIMADPAYRLIGAYVVEPLGRMDSVLDNGTPGEAAQVLAQLARGFADPALWIGLLVAAALVFAASEIRRRRTL